MSNEPCPFCKSKTRKIETPYLDKSGQKEYNWCCNAMKTNQKFVSERYHQSRGEVPNVDEVSKW